MPPEQGEEPASDGVHLVLHDVQSQEVLILVRPLAPCLQVLRQLTAAAPGVRQVPALVVLLSLFGPQPPGIFLPGHVDVVLFAEGLDVGGGLDLVLVDPFVFLGVALDFLGAVVEDRVFEALEGVVVGGHVHPVLEGRAVVEGLALEGVEILILVLVLFLLLVDFGGAEVVFGEVRFLFLLVLFGEVLDRPAVVPNRQVLRLDLLVLDHQDPVQGLQLLQDVLHPQVQPRVLVAQLQHLLVLVIRDCRLVLHLPLQFGNLAMQLRYLQLVFVGLAGRLLLLRALMRHVALQLVLEVGVLLLEPVDGFAEVILGAGAVEGLVRDVAVVFAGVGGRGGPGEQLAIPRDKVVRLDVVCCHE